jgi:hypothetical protein
MSNIVLLLNTMVVSDLRCLLGEFLHELETVLGSWREVSSSLDSFADQFGYLDNYLNTLTDTRLPVNLLITGVVLEKEHATSLTYDVWVCLTKSFQLGRYGLEMAGIRHELRLRHEQHSAGI